jgi:DNA invertase Pin-like site-specific DNA recombinase
MTTKKETPKGGAKGYHERMVIGYHKDSRVFRKNQVIRKKILSKLKSPKSVKDLVIETGLSPYYVKKIINELLYKGMITYTRIRCHKCNRLMPHYQRKGGRR